MTDLTPISAFGDLAPRQAQIGALTLRENSGLALAALSLRHGAALPALPLPAVGQWQKTGDLSAFWLGQEQWMIEGEGRAEEDFALYVKGLAHECSVVEQTDAWVCVEITGPAPALERLLERLVNLDPARLGAGTATRTGLEHMSVILLRRAPEHLAIMGMRSAAGSLWHVLERAA